RSENGGLRSELPLRVPSTTEVAGTRYRLDAPGTPVRHVVVKSCPGSRSRENFREPADWVRVLATSLALSTRTGSSSPPEHLQRHPERRHSPHRHDQQWQGHAAPAESLQHRAPNRVDRRREWERLDERLR